MWLTTSPVVHFCMVNWVIKKVDTVVNRKKGVLTGPFIYLFAFEPWSCRFNPQFLLFDGVVSAATRARVRVCVCVCGLVWFGLMVA